MKLSIIYVNYNTTELTLASIASLSQLRDISYEVIVVDNASAKFDPTDITNDFPHANVITSSENLGFGRGNNLGAAAANGEYLWILNTDTLVPPDHNLGELIAFLDEHRDYAAALPLLTNQSGEVQPAQVAYLPSPSRVVANIPVRLMSKIIPSWKKLYGRVSMDYLEPKESDVEVAVAAALVVRRSAFEAIGGFSPEFFMFFEDSDLCHKLLQKGFKIRWVTASHLVHLWGKSITGSRSFARRKQLYFQSQDVYIAKWHGWSARLLIKVLRAPLQLRYLLLNR